MSSKQFILDRVRQFKPGTSPLPEVPMFESKEVDLLAQFKANLEFVGGKAEVVASLEEANQAISALYPDMAKVTSTVSGIGIANVDSEAITDPHDLKELDLVVLKGAFGVAENGAVWIPSTTISHRVLPFITQHLVIILDKNRLVWNMHQAYQQPEIALADGFGVFLSGPSKTADIEQSLVIGAHGSRSLMVYLLE